MADVRVREVHLSVAGAQIYVRVVGSGTPLIVVHGGPDLNHSYLLPDMDHLSTAFRLIYYDQRGRGKSSPGVVPEDVSIDSEIADLDAVRRHHTDTAVAVLGHSWGGLLAAEYATRHPDHVSHLVLLNTAPLSHEDNLAFRQNRERTDADRLAKIRRLAAMAEFQAGDITAEAELCRLHFGSTVPPEYLDKVVDSLRVHFTPADILKARAIEGRLYAQTWDMPEYDLVSKLQELETPALVVHGDRDFIPLAGAKRIATAMRNAELLVLKDCGHFSFIERPDTVLEALRTFLSR